MTVIGYQNVLGLQVPVVDPNGVAELDSVQKLKEDMLGQSVVAHKTALFSNIREQIAFGTVFDDNECAVWAVQNPHEGNDIRMLAGLVMQSNLPLLKP